MFCNTRIWTCSCRHFKGWWWWDLSKTQFLNQLNKIWMALDFITCNCSMGGCSTGSGVGSGTCSAFAWEIVAKGSSSCGGGSTTSNEDGSWIYKSICFYFTGLSWILILKNLILTMRNKSSDDPVYKSRHRAPRTKINPWVPVESRAFYRCKLTVFLCWQPDCNSEVERP